MRVFVTGAGGPAAVCLLRAWARRPDVELWAADMDPCAVGLYMVPPSRRFLVPRGDSPEFVDAVYKLVADKVDILVPTVDTEMIPLAKARGLFADAGVRIMSANAEALTLCLDKLQTVRALDGIIPVPETYLGGEAPPDFGPCIVKPRSGSGGRGISQHDRVPEGLGSDVIVQQLLPGTEYSVDTFRGTRTLAVPRVRLKVDSGVAVAGKTLKDPELEHYAIRAAEALNLRFINNIQFKRDAEGAPRLLEINPRAPGTLALSIHAGIPMPDLALNLMAGQPTPELSYREVAMVRHWEEIFMDPDAFMK